MALNTSLTQLVTSTTSLVATGTSVLSLGSQILNKTMAYIRNEKPVRGINGFLLDVVKETVVDLNSDITDYPLEENFQVQSHYARRPVKINITGICSDIRVHNPNDEWELEDLLDDLTEMTEKLEMIAQNLDIGSTAKESARVVAFMKTVHTLYRKVKETYNTLSKMLKLFGMDFGQGEETSQIKAYRVLKEYWENGTVLQVETHWETFSNCVIESLSFRQPENTVQQTMIDITFKQLTLTNVSVLEKAIVDGKRAKQLASKVASTSSNESTKSTLELISEKSLGSTKAGQKAKSEMCQNTKNQADKSR